MMMRTALLSCFFLLTVSEVEAADIPVPVASDSRIKTFVYSENDVFDVVTHYGFESNVEFGREESIETISVGDRTAFQIVPSGRRLFIRPLAMNARTNMTVVTDKHAYQFDISAMPAPTSPTEEISYVVRFYYPDDRRTGLPMVTPSMGPASYASASGPAQQMGGYNYNYTFTGSDATAPTKIYDDGSATYFKLRSDAEPHLAQVGADGKESSVALRRAGDYWVADQVAARFTLRQGGAVTNIYNEKWSR